MSDLDTKSEEGATASTFESQNEQPRENAGRADQGAADTGRPDGGAPPPGYVPQEALHAARQEISDLRRRNEAHDREMAEFRGFMNGSKKPPEPEKPVTLWDNPDEYIRRQIEAAQKPVSEKVTATEGRISNDRLNMSQRFAAQEFGQDATVAAFQAAQEAQAANPAAFRFEYDRIMNSDHPWGELVKWHKNQSTLSKFGTDPDAYIQAEVERRLQERLNAGDDQAGTVAAPAAPVAGAKPKPPMPTNLAGARSAGSRSTPQWSGPRPIEAIFGR